MRVAKTYTDSERIEALARALSSLVVYDSTGCRIKVDSGNAVKIPTGRGKRVKKIHKGLDVAFVREIADGLMDGQLVNGARDTLGLRSGEFFASE